VLRLAKTLYEWAQRKEWNDIEQELERNRIVTDSVRKKLMRIGAHAILMNETHWTKLPLGYNAVYNLSLIEAPDLTKLIKSNKVHPGLTIAETANLKDTYRSKPAPAPRKTKRLTYTLKITVAADISGIDKAVKSHIRAMEKAIKSIDRNATIVSQ
jgi:hypothetical protein